LRLIPFNKSSTHDNMFLYVSISFILPALILLKRMFYLWFNHFLKLICCWEGWNESLMMGLSLWNCEETYQLIPIPLLPSRFKSPTWVLLSRWGTDCTKSGKEMQSFSSSSNAGKIIAYTIQPEFFFMGIYFIENEYTRDKFYSMILLILITENLYYAYTIFLNKYFPNIVLHQVL